MEQFASGDTLPSDVFGTITAPILVNYTETPFASTGVSNVFTLAMSDGTWQKVTTAANSTVKLPPVSGNAGKSLVLYVYKGGAHTLTIQDSAGSSPGVIRWENNTAPTDTVTNGKVDIYLFGCDGTNWFGSNGGRNY